MEKDFTPYDRALRLKEIGFDEPCFGYYKPNRELGYIENHILKDFPFLAKNSEWQDLVAAPTFSQAFRWFREKHNLIAEFNYHSPSKCYATSIFPSSFYIHKKNYEEAELACLDKLLEIVEGIESQK